METAAKSPTPAAHTHDGFFKAVFSQPEHATAFFKSHLPPEVVARILLVVLPGSFIKSSLQQAHADSECDPEKIYPRPIAKSHCRNPLHRGPPQSGPEFTVYRALEEAS